MNYMEPPVSNPSSPAWTEEQQLVAQLLYLKFFNQLKIMQQRLTICGSIITLCAHNFLWYESNWFRRLEGLTEVQTPKEETDDLPGVQDPEEETDFNPHYNSAADFGCQAVTEPPECSQISDDNFSQEEDTFENIPAELARDLQEKVQILEDLLLQLQKYCKYSPLEPQSIIQHRRAKNKRVRGVIKHSEHCSAYFEQTHTTSQISNPRTDILPDTLLQVPSEQTFFFHYRSAKNKQFQSADKNLENYRASSDQNYKSVRIKARSNCACAPRKPYTPETQFQELFELVT